jgi:hypothetical protein
MPTNNKFIDYGLPALSLVITTILGFETYDLSKTTEGYKRQADKFETNTKEYAAITDLLQKCTSDAKGDQNYIIFLATSRQKKSFDLVSANPVLKDDAEFKKNFQSTLDACLTWAFNGGSTTAPESKGSDTVAKGGSEVADGTPESWVYLGNYDGRQWKSSYLDFPTDFNPRTYSNKDSTESGPTFAVREQTGSLYLRTGAFTSNGAFPPIKRALMTGTRVQIERTWPWQGGNDWWAVVKVKS